MRKVAQAERHATGERVGATIIDGKASGRAARAGRRGRRRVRRPLRPQPGLVGIQVGDDPASEIYQANKAKAAEAGGMASRRVKLPAETTQAELDALIDELNADDTVDGMLVQLPVPEQLSRAG